MYRFDENNIFYKSPRAEGKLSWTVIQKIISAKDYLYIIFSAGAVTPIPRAQVPPETLQELQVAIEEKIKTGAQITT